MGKFSPISKIIDDALLLDLGNPNGAISDKERLIKESAIRLGCLDYYRSFPMRIIYLTSYNTSANGGTSLAWAGLPAPKIDNGSMYIPFEDFYTMGNPKVPTEQIEHAHFLGIMRIERPAWGNWANPSKWSTQMFGFPMTGNTSNFDIQADLLSNTIDELSTGQPFCTINRMQNRVEVTNAWGLGQLSIYAGIGFDSPEYVEMSKVDFLLKFISLRFIEAIIQARTGVTFDADFTISTEHLQKRLDKLREEVDSIKNHSVLHINQWA